MNTKSTSKTIRNTRNARTRNTGAPASGKTTKTEKTPSNNIGSTILATSSMLSATFGRKADGRSVASQIALEKAGIIRPIADRVASGLTLTESGYRHFKKLAKGEGKEAEGAAKVLDIVNKLRDRVKEIAAYKAAQAAAAESGAESSTEVPAATEA